MKLVGEEFVDCELDELESLGNNGLIQTLQNNNTMSLCQKEGSFLVRGECLQEPTQLGHTVHEHVMSLCRTSQEVEVFLVVNNTQIHLDYKYKSLF